MVLPTTTRVIQYGGPILATTVLAVPFRMFENDAIFAVGSDIDGSNERTLVEGVDYELTGVTNPTGGSLILTLDVPEDQLTIFRDLVENQLSKYVEGDAFPSATHETILDRTIAMVQELAEAEGRTLTVPITTGAGFDATLPPPVAGEALAYDSPTPNKFVTVPVDAVSLQQAVDDAEAAEAAATAAAGVATAAGISAASSAADAAAAQAAAEAAQAAAEAAVFPAGTRMVFQQDPAPTGWTIDASLNEHALRVVSGSVGTGGSVNFSSALGAGSTISGSVSGNTGSHTLTIGEMPSHDHIMGGAAGAISVPLLAVGGYGAVATSTTGGGGGHSHPNAGAVSGNAAINVKYADCVVAAKD